MSDSIWRTIYGLLAFIGIASAIWGYETYLLTFINPWFTIILSLTPTIPIFFLIRKHYSKIYKTNRTYFPFLQSLFSVGLLTTSLFLISNYEFSTSERKTENYNIIEKGTLGGRNHKPYAIIDRKDLTKKLVFKGNPTIHSDDQINLTIQRGLFGFDIIIEQLVTDNN